MEMEFVFFTTNRRWILLGVGLLLCLSQVTSKLPHQILVISFDGFRWDYLDVVNKAGYETPNFNDLIKRGSKAKWMKNAYTTITFPNHYTIATGLYEENHGVVGNNMFDPKLNEVFTGRLGQMQESKWFNNGTDDWPGEPIWLTNQKASGQRSGVYYWVGSEVAIRGKRPYNYTHYNMSMPYEDRVNTVVQWLSADENPVNFAMLYFDEPDSTGHAEGPNSVALKEQIVKLDTLLGYIVNTLKEHDVYDTLDLIITSDHGMSEMAETIIYLEEHVDSALYEVYGDTPVLHIQPQEGYESKVYDDLLKVPNIHVYKKEDIPLEYHYQQNRRIQPIIIEAYEPYFICKEQKDCYFEKGDHGYNNSHPNMHPIFIASGPSFKENYISEPFNNVDIYPLLCHLLGVEPAQHDGNLNVIGHLLKKNVVTTATDDDKEAYRVGTMLAVGIAFGVLFVVVGIFIILKLITRKSSRESHVVVQPEDELLLENDALANDLSIA